MPESTDAGLQAYNTITMKEIYESAMAASPMPRYRSHKTVSALKIAKVKRDEWGIGLVFEDRGFMVKPFTNDQLKGKPDPQDGWYMVVYRDGYTSFSPAQEFEDGYTKI
jgi:hypothetical protein